MQYVFLNGRHIRDRALQHALSEAYRGLLLTGRYPIGFLRLEIPADQVDVNVHPTKLEVRFQDGGRVYSRLLSTLRQKFLSTDLTAHVRPPSEGGSPATGGHDQDQAERHRDEMLRWAKGQLEAGTATGGPADGIGGPADGIGGPADGIGGAGGASPAGATDGASPVAGSSQRRWTWDDASGRNAPAPFRPFPNDFGRMPSSNAPHPDNSAGQGYSQAAAGESTGSPPGSRDNPQRSGGIQVHNRYLITENEAGVVIIDQHALHERIVYEQLREKVLSGTLERQRLLVPEPVSLTPSETATALESREVLQQLGIDIEPFGGDTILVSSYPAMLANFDPQEVLRQIIDQLMSGGKQPERRDLLDEMLHMISCKAAIKAGDRLSPDEVTALLDQRHLYQDTHHCPHGRPTALVFSREELDRRFKRT
jgi:DNA mismatch repair protein MutL